MVVILRNFLKVICFCCCLFCLGGCSEPNYFENVKNDKTTEATEIATTTEISTECVTTEHHSIFPDSVYDYDVTDTILVPKD